MLVYYIFIGSIILLISTVLGLNLASNIETPIVYALFWLLYIITILTIINIILSAYYYLRVKDKRGPAGRRGPAGDPGGHGEVGKCDINCRESICSNAITAAVINHLQSFGEETSIKLNNMYIKQKIKSLCQSPEFAELAPYKGADTLIKYLTEIWLEWTTLLYDAGGRVYFETLGAEMEWEWLDGSNPFDEIKKYDMFYWGLGTEYKPRIVEKCYMKDDAGNIMHDSTIKLLKTTSSNNLTRVGTIRSPAHTASIWRAKAITYDDVDYYPMGDVVIGPNSTGAADSTRQKIRYSDIILSSYIDAPVLNTYLVGGEYTAPPVDYEPIWNNGSLWIWRPLPPAGYVAFGDVATMTKLKPEINERAPVRCIAVIAAKQLKSPAKVLWSAKGTTNIAVTIMGLNQLNSGNMVAGDVNGYNLFRMVKGFVTTIPPSDRAAAFYRLSEDYYDINDQLGKAEGIPSYKKENDKTSRGWLHTPKKDVKYSIMGGYLNLKANMKARSSSDKSSNKKGKSYSEFELMLNTTFGTSNSYVIKLKNDKCIDISADAISFKLCNMARIEQCFRVEYTGRTKGQFNLRHIPTDAYLSYDSESNIFKLVDECRGDGCIFYVDAA